MFLFLCKSFYFDLKNNTFHFQKKQNIMIFVKSMKNTSFLENIILIFKKYIMVISLKGTIFII